MEDQGNVLTLNLTSNKKVNPVSFEIQVHVQGDHSACSKPPLDIDLKVAFEYKVLLLKRNFQINVNKMF